MDLLRHDISFGTTGGFTYDAHGPFWRFAAGAIVALVAARRLDPLLRAADDPRLPRTELVA